MITKELTQFIQQSISQGKTKEEIRNMLLANGGWQESDIEEAFSSAEDKASSFPWLVVIVLLLVLAGGIYFIVEKTDLLKSNTDLSIEQSGNFEFDIEVPLEPLSEEGRILFAYVRSVNGNTIVVDEVEMLPPNPSNPSSQIKNDILEEESFSLNQDTEFTFQTRGMNQETGQYRPGEAVDYEAAVDSLTSEGRFAGSDASVPFLVTIGEVSGNVLSLIEIYDPIATGDVSLQEISDEIQTDSVTDSQKTSETVISLEVRPTDCVNDAECFIDAAEICSPAFVQENKVLNIFGMIQTSKIKSTLYGLNSSKKCVYSSYVVDASLNYSPEMEAQAKAAGATDEELRLQLEESNEEVKLTIGTLTECSFESSYLKELLTKWVDGSFSSNDMNQGNCSITRGSNTTL